MSFRHSIAIVLTAAVAAGACSERATLPVESGIGPNPTLPAPNKTLIPTVKIAPARGWPTGASRSPRRASTVNAFATGLEHPRWLLRAAERRRAGRRDQRAAQARRTARACKRLVHEAVHEEGRRRRAERRTASRCCATPTATASPRRARVPRRSALAVRHGAGRQRPLRRQHRCGRALSVRRGETRITAPAMKVVDLPAGPINHHWTKNLIASPDGSELYVTVGSNSNVAENGMAAEAGRAAIWEIDRETRRAPRVRVRAAQPGRHGVGAGDAARCGRSVNERDELGSDLVPDYMTSVRDGGFYGWPYSYYGAARRRAREAAAARIWSRRRSCPTTRWARTPRRSASRSSRGDALPPQFGERHVRRPARLVEPQAAQRLQGDLRAVRAAASRPGQPIDVLTGFLNADGDAYGRPVGVAIDGAARCWSPTTSATRSGASPVRADWRRRCCPPTSRSAPQARFATIVFFR